MNAFMKRVLFGASGVAMIGLLPSAALAHEGDVEVETSGSALLVPPTPEGFLVYEGEFGIPGFAANQSDEPGYAAEETLAPGTVLGFNVVSDLLYWDGAQLAAIPAGHSLTVTHPSGLPALGEITLDGSADAQPGFNFATADGLGALDEHTLFTLNGPGAPDGLAPGAYGLWLELTSPTYATSNSYIILLNYGLDEADFEAGVDYIGTNIIPEPASALLLGLLGLAALRRR